MTARITARLAATAAFIAVLVALPARAQHGGGHGGGSHGESDSDNRRDVSGQIHEEPRAGRTEPMPASGGNVARLRIQVTPGDAAVYLDGRLLGTGEDLSARSRGVRTTAGKHSIRVTRPEFKMKALDVEVVGGKTIDVVIVLER